MTDHARLFELHRDADVSGVSGTGKVAEGVLFSDGEAAIHWLGQWPTTTAHPRGLASIKAVHGHGGATRIVLSDSPADRLSRIAQAHSKDQAAAGSTSGECSECGHAWPCPTYAWATEERDPLAPWDPADDEPAAEPCSAGLLPEGDRPAERCMVEGAHETHVSPTGKRWQS
jgi:hypothetical protein